MKIMLRLCGYRALLEESCANLSTCFAFAEKQVAKPQRIIDILNRIVTTFSTKLLLTLTYNVT